ncbi:hypothetical protein PSTT_08606 [Puccinia striiformis]|uniref:WHIM1 domain-containing protein n=1 Tax=Puccinia striiformis TaxID=27350 RepID=A0A2S4VBL5_9BASI|nr:hypothetical protein PSTT_08606 [Puccinia striiformis]
MAPSAALGLGPVPSKPSESWETAYVFAFIYRFTSLCHDLQIGLKLRAAQDLERILEVDTRTSPSGSTEEPSPASPESDAREILTAILSTFHDNLKTANASAWARWLKTYIEDLVKHELQQPMFSILKWEENYLRTRENGFWDLDWQEKVHLLRVLVDHQLTYSTKIKSIIDENYDKPAVKSTKQQTNLSTKVDVKSSQNTLLIKPLGVDRNSCIWWQIDDSPRIYGSGNPAKSEHYWKVLSTTQSEYDELSSKLDVNPVLRSSDPSQVIPDPSGTEKPPAKKVKIPSMFSSSRKKTAQQEQHLQAEWDLGQKLTEVAQVNIEAGEQRIEQLIKEARRLEDIEARKQRRIALANAPKRDADLTRATPGFGVRSRLRSQLTKPDYVCDSDIIDRKLERAIQQYEKSSTGGSDSGKKAKHSKRKRKGRANDSRDSDSEDSEYNSGHEASVAGSNDGDDTTEIDGSTETGRPSRKRARGPKKVAAPAERRSLRVRTKIEVEAEEEPKSLVVEEESQPSASTWSRSKPPVSSSNSEVPEGPSADSVDLNGNVSVWSRGKLIYTAGNNKCKVFPSHQSCIESCSTCTLQFSDTSKPGSAPEEPNAVASNSLSGLQARLEAMAGDDDDENENDKNSTNLGEDDKKDAAPTHREALEGIDQETQQGPSLSNLFDIEDNPIQVDIGTSKSASEHLEGGKASTSSTIIEMLHEKPARTQSGQDEATHNQIHIASPAGPVQHINAPVLSSIV